MWLLLGPALNKARRDVLGLPPLPIFGPIASYLDPRLSLDAYSPLVAPPPPDWNVRHHVTGFWFLKTDPWQPPKELVDFLDAGPPPICIGFGSMHDRDAMRVTKIVIRAVEQSGQRAVLLTGWGGLRRMPASERLFWADVLPHAWLFPRTAGVVHHGGAGSTAAGLCAGVPSLVVPFMSDQPFWGRRVYELGVGPSPIPHSRLSVEGLVKCIRQMMDDEDMRRRAAELGKRIRTEDGVGRAVDLLERYFQLPTRQFPIASTWMAIRTFASNLRNPKKSKGIRESAVASA